MDYLSWQICVYKLIITLYFPGDGRWRQVIRRCASVSDTGVVGVCNWGVYENGVYWEECYCSSDSCNGSSLVQMHGSLQLLLGLLLIGIASRIFRS